MQAEDWDRINEHVKAKQFELGANLPIAWKAKAINLKRAADKLYDLYHDASSRIRVREVKRSARKKKSATETRILKGKELEDHHDSQLISVYFLLMGYAIENLLKGILMLSHPEYFKPKGKLANIKSHDLLKLCERCGISVSRQDAELLDELTRHVEWQGKYPVPLESDKMLPLKKDDGDWVYSGVAFHSRQRQQELDRVYQTIWKELERLQATVAHSNVK